MCTPAGNSKREINKKSRNKREVSNELRVVRLTAKLRRNINQKRHTTEGAVLMKDETAESQEQEDGINGEWDGKTRGRYRYGGYPAFRTPIYITHGWWVKWRDNIIRLGMGRNSKCSLSDRILDRNLPSLSASIPNSHPQPSSSSQCTANDWRQDKYSVLDRVS